MSKILESKQARNKVIEEMKSLNAAISGEMTPEQNEKWEELSKREDALAKEIQRLERIERMQLDQIDEKETTFLTQPEEKVDYRSSFRKWLRGGVAALSVTERAKIMEKRTQITTTDSLGGYLVPELVADEICKHMQQLGGLFEAGRLVQTASGAPITWPSIDDTAQTGEAVAEGTAKTVQDTTFGGVTTTPIMIDSKILKVSVQLVIDTFFNLEDFIWPILTERVWKYTESSLTPALVTALGANDVTGTISRVNLIDLIHSVPAPYRTSSKALFMLSDADLAAIKKLTNGTGDDRPLWEPNMRDGAPSTIEGYPYVINNFLSAGTVLFGDFSKYILHQAGGMILKRSEHRYFEENAVGYLAEHMIDGALCDTTAIALLAAL